MSALTPVGRLMLRPSVVLVQSQCLNSKRLFSNGKKKVTKDEKSSGGASQSKYQVEEYFGYNPHSYYDLEVSMAKYRLKQPKPQSNSNK